MKRIIFMFLATALLVSCKDEGYMSFLEPASLDHITMISISPNSPMLTADGVSELTFNVKAFTQVSDTRKVEKIVNNESMFEDETFTVLTEVKTDRLNMNDFVITTSRGETLPAGEFTYTSTTAGDVTFTIKYTPGNLTGEPRTVSLVAKPTPNYTKRTIPVIFHLAPLASDKNTYDGITSAFLQGLLDKTNAGFAGTLANDPMAGDANVEFVLATKGPSGNTLAEAGINRTDGMINLKNAAGNAPSAADAMTWLSNNGMIWDTDMYLNIWSCSVLASTAVLAPPYILDNGTDIPYLGTLAQRTEYLYDPDTGAYLGTRVVWEYDLTKIDDPGQATYLANAINKAGIALSLSNYLQYDVRTSFGASGLASRFGAFFGLINTRYHSGQWAAQSEIDTDACADTYTEYEYGNSADYELSVYIEGVNTSDPGEYMGKTIDFELYNIMSGGRRSSFTWGQIARMRAVMENCPLRMMKQD